MLIMALIITIIFYFRLGYVSIFFLLLFYQGVSLAYNKKFSMALMGRGAIQIAGLLMVLWYFSRFGTWGFIATVIIVCLYILLSRRKDYLSVKYQIETMLWGKPLKDFKRGRDIPKIVISGFRPHKSTKKYQPK